MVAVSDKVLVRIIKVNTEERKIGLSLMEVVERSPEGIKKAAAAAEAAENASNEAAPAPEASADVAPEAPEASADEAPAAEEPAAETEASSEEEKPSDS